ncbi:transglutaminase TgpA family protein [Litorilituus sediminis]|uniref:DUF3488 domain-containing protein n=1 Tax=Litorilituus sediminis TaxID=718192 RepID=A0A4P6P0Z4_9GAMM|nr:DUF3488 and transglutaminase-like domain-containing protein [Litorilituus sediminis]QBG34681.1 DUF3488 domain-containing protein [Litorilituus sediminis]
MLKFSPIAASKAKKSAAKPLVLANSTAWLLLVSQCVNVLAIAGELRFWMIAILAMCFGWQAVALLKYRANFRANKPKAQTSTKRRSLINYQEDNGLILISPLLLTLFAVLGCVAIFSSASSLGLLLSMVHLLCFSYVLKGFELTKRKDFYQLFLLGLFVLISALIFKQGIVFSLLVILAIVLNLSVIVHYFSPSNKVANVFKLVSVLLLQSSILAIALFLFFPRLSPFWQVPIAKSAQTGLSDIVQPGDIANLARSNTLAFRVEFADGQVPEYSQRYWRAMVMEDYDGQKWQIAKSHNTQVMASSFELTGNKQLKPITQGDGLDYRVIVEPNFQQWLYVLAVATAQGEVSLFPDYTIQSKKVISQTMAFKFTSYLNSPLDKVLSEQSRQINLALPEQSNPRLYQLGQQLLSQYSNPQDRINAVLNSFSQDMFYYTLQPPLLSNNSLDQFYFDTKAGFCGHYASSFTFLMRAAGIPARVVTGYLGGEVNDLATTGDGQIGHLNVYQYDAHAWAEVWLEGIGWQRVDPTGAVDPSRVDSGLSSQLIEQQAALTSDLFSLSNYKQFDWLNSLRLTIDALDYQWTKWVLGYSTEQQYNLLKKLVGQVLPWKIGLIICIALISSMALILFIFKVKSHLASRRSNSSPSYKLYQTVLFALAKKGIVKAPYSTAGEFALELRENYPELAIAFTRFNQSFEKLSYQQLSASEQQQLLKLMRSQHRQFMQLLAKEV